MRLSDFRSTPLAQSIIGNPDVHVSFSQFGEDLTLYTLLEMHGRLKRKGFYVDVGAFHPSNSSNTNLIRKAFGWNGINIEANPERVSLFEKECPDCINICAVISDIEEEVVFSLLDQPGMATADPDMIERAAKRGVGLSKQWTAKTRLLSEVIESAGDIPTADFLNVDVEGFDLRVLMSNNWNKYRPFLVMVENLEMNLEKLFENPIKSFMNGVGYNLVCQSFVTSFYRDRTV